MTDPNPRGKRRIRDQSPKSSGFGERKEVKPPAYPSLGRQARNLAQTAGQIARNPRVASSELYEERMKVCRACTFFDEEQVRCRKCGCRLKGKAKFEGAHCPIKKW